MKTTLEIPDELLRQTKATAALRGESMRAFVTTALRLHLARSLTKDTSPPGWQRVFGRARAEDVAEVDRIIEAEFSSSLF